MPALNKLVQDLFNPNLIQAVGLFGQKKYEEAEDILRLYVATHPDNMDGHEWYVTCLIKLDKTPEALAHAEKIVRQRPQNAVIDFYLNAVMEHSDSLKPRKALSILKAQFQFFQTAGISLLPRHRQFIKDLINDIVVPNKPQRLDLDRIPSQDL